MPDRDAIAAALDAPLDPKHVRTRTQSGTTLSYIEGWHAIYEANRIFGWDGWVRETIEMRECRAPELIDGKWRVGFICKARITAGSTVRDGWGYGSGIAKDMGDAYESAVKEAETDAMKRALMTFGNPFGLALYDKKRANVGRPDVVVHGNDRPAPDTGEPVYDGNDRPAPDTGEPVYDGNGGDGGIIRQTWEEIVLSQLPPNANPRQKAEAYAEQLIAEFKKYKSLRGLEGAWTKYEKIIDRLRAHYSDLYSNLYDAYDREERKFKDADATPIVRRLWP